MKNKFLIIIAGVAIIAGLVFLSFGNRQDSQVPVSGIEETQVDESVEEVVPETTEEEVIETEEEESVEEVVTQPEEVQGVSEEATAPQPETEEVVEEQPETVPQDSTEVQEASTSEAVPENSEVSDSEVSVDDVISLFEQQGITASGLHDTDNTPHEGLNWQ